MKDFYVFSGIDGAGKSTQIELLDGHFNSKGLNTEIIWSRGGYTPIFQQIKSFLRKVRFKKLPPPGRTTERKKAFENPLVRKVWLTIAIIDLFLLYGIYMRWCILTGKVIVADRYLEDTSMDFQLNFPSEKVENWFLWKMLRFFIPTPKKHFILLIPVEESLKRSLQKNEPFPDSEETLRSRHQSYSELLFDNNRFIHVDCTTSIDEVHQQILENIS